MHGIVKSGLVQEDKLRTMRLKVDEADVTLDCRIKLLLSDK